MIIFPSLSGDEKKPDVRFSDQTRPFKEYKYSYSGHIIYVFTPKDITKYSVFMLKHNLHIIYSK